MKKIILVLFLAAPLLFAQSSAKQNEIEKNLIAGVKSGNLGLKVSSMYQLGEMRSSKAVIPMMEVLKSDNEPSARIMAAMSLFKIGDARGIFAIEQAVKFDDNEQVKKMCQVFVNMKNTQNKTLPEVDKK